MSQNSRGRAPSQSTCESWHEEFPSDAVVCLVDEDQAITSWFGVAGFPWALMTDSEGVVEVLDRRNNNLAPLDEIQDRYGR